MNAETTLEVLAKSYAEKKLAYELAGLQNIAGLTSPELLENRVVYDRLRDDYLRAEKEYQDALKANYSGATELPAQTQPDEQAAFEDWYSDGKFSKSIERVDNGYKLMQTHQAWRVWQARAALTPPVSAPIAVAPEIVAWASNDGRVVPQSTMQGAINDKGAMLSSMRPYIHPLGRIVAAPQSSAVPVAAVQAQGDANAKEHAVQQAQQWAQEARAQRSTVIGILRSLGLPENDWEAESLVAAKFAALQSTPVSDKVAVSHGDLSKPGLDLEGVPQPFAGAIVLLETIAECGAQAFYDGGQPTPNRELCLRFAKELRAAALSQPPAVEAPSELHDAIMNLRCNTDKCATKDWALAYKHGHRDARHAAAELVVALPAPLPKAEAATALTHQRMLNAGFVTCGSGIDGVLYLGTIKDAEALARSAVQPSKYGSPELQALIVAKAMEDVQPAQGAQEYTPGKWFKAKTLDEMQAFYIACLPAIREAAKEHGYAIGLHGSTRRDLDLMAMQWRDDAADKDTLAHAIAVAACGITRDTHQWEQKPSGRFAVSMPICWTDHKNPDFKDKLSVGHIDLSLIPSAEAQGTQAGQSELRKLYTELTNGDLVRDGESVSGYLITHAQLKRFDGLTQQGTQAVPEEMQIGVVVEEGFTQIVITQKHKDSSRTVYSERHSLGESIGQFVLVGSPKQQNSEVPK